MSTIKHSFSSMNTTVEMYLESVADGRESFVITEVNQLFSIIESQCSRFNQQSELSALNSSQGKVVQVSPALLQILQAAEKAYFQSEGIYNPGILRQLQMAGYNTSFDEIQQSGPSSQRREVCNPVDKLPYQIIDPEKRLVEVIDQVGIDLGGIAKGWCVDHVSEFLSLHGCGYINAGGDLRVFGQRKESWKIGVEDPFQPNRDKAVVHLTKGAVATSSTWKRKWRVGNVSNHHLIDPRTGKPSDSTIVSATIMAHDTVAADVAAKVVLILGENEGAAWARKHSYQGFMILLDGEFRRIG
ncbi:FAD:protein FMN transferase [Brevibacillus sp. SYSU BS000544]|uniref:FAD:protein FMN transferase n=1 Tax=Brevibacillus sp. SYSU BS000544 TaxID=3416443 RepID=UPI003CE544AB